MVSFLDLLVEQGQWIFADFPLTYTWEVGQPLGLGPSFPLFSISHGALLLLLNKGKWNKAFYVVGDDVIIFDNTLAAAYRKILISWQVPVSERKTFTSSKLAQFAGLTYTPHGSFWLPKWRKLTRETLVDVCAFWYKGFTDGLNRKDSVLIGRVLALPAPWGIGRNPSGIPLTERLTDQLVCKLLEIESDRQAKAKPSSIQRFSSYALHDPRVFSWRQEFKPLRSTRPYLFSPSFDPLMDHTEASGYPRLRMRKLNKNPYTLGRTQYWSNLFDLLDALTPGSPERNTDPS